MDSNNSGERESGSSDHKKRKMIWDQELPHHLRKRIKRAVSSQALSEASSTPATGQELESSSGSQPPQTSLDLLHKAQFSASHFSGAHHCIFNGATFINNNIHDDRVMVAEPDSQTRSSDGIIEGPPALSVEAVSIEQEIYKGRGYRVHAATMSGKVVAMKVYEGNRARERCLEAVRFNQNIIHPNIAQMIGVSPLKSGLSYLIFDGEYEGAVHDILGQVLKKDLKQVVTLGLQTVVGLSSGLDYLQDSEYPFASVGLDHFALLSRKGKPIICFDPDDLSQINQSDDEPDVSNSAEDVFHELCARTFDSACKARYESKHIQRAHADEFDTNVNDLPENRFEELDSSDLVPSSLTSGGPSTLIPPRKVLPSGRLQELVWKHPTAETVSLNDISHQFQNFLNAHLLSSEPALIRRRGRYTGRTAHRCPGYNRIEITLTANITHSAIVSHSSPIPHEICPVCKEVVKDTDVFNCICGGDDDEPMSTVRCTSCSEWHHQSCVIALDVEPLIYVCARCQKRDAEQAGLHREVLELKLPLDPNRAESLHDLAIALSTRFQKNGDIKDLEESIRYHRVAMELSPATHPYRFTLLNHFGRVLFTRFKRMGDFEDLEESIRRYQEALELRPPLHPDRVQLLNDLAVTRSTRFEQKGDFKDLDESIRCYREALELSPAPHPYRSISLNNLGCELSTRFQRKEDLKDLDESIQCHQEALELRSPLLPRAQSLSDLAFALFTRFQQKGDFEDLDESIRCSQESLGLRPPLDPYRARALNDLAFALLTRYQRKGDFKDLEESIRYHREATELLPALHPKRPLSLNNLATALSARFQKKGNIEDLDESIRCYREALELSPAPHSKRPQWLNDLANLLSTRFQLQENIEDLDESIRCRREALELGA